MGSSDTPRDRTSILPPPEPDSLRSEPAATGSWGSAEALTQVGEPLRPGAVLRDRFVLTAELGRGGMGVVYKAEDRHRGDMKDRFVAIKVLSENFKRHPLAVKSLQREARKAQRLAHPNIVTVHDLDRDGGHFFMVMELLTGRSLDRVLREDGHGGIPLGPAQEIIRCLAAALSYAHEHDIVHCDFKPGNAFLGQDGRVKVLDFGIARAVPSITNEGADQTLFDAGALGAVSPAYTSLELLQGEKPDVRDDVYSFACVAYELLSGVHPFQRIDAVKAFRSELQPRPIEKLSRSQWRALRQGLAFRRADRTPSIEALARGLLAPRFDSRPWVLGLAAAGAAVLIAGVGLLIWSGVHRHALAPTAAVTQPPPIVAPPRPSAASPAPAPSPVAVPVQPAPPTAAATSAPARSSAPAVAAETTPPTVKPQVPAGTHPTSAKQVEIEVLKEQFESEAIAGDVEGSAKSAAALLRAAPGSSYATIEVPRIAALAYARRAKSQLLGGQVNEALATLAEGRRRYGYSMDLKTQEAEYVAVGDLYDRISSAVVLNPIATRQALDDLKAQLGQEFPATDRMLAQTLADRIADQRAAGRNTVADALLKTGQPLFADNAALLSKGQAGKLSAPAIDIGDPDSSAPPPN